MSDEKYRVLILDDDYELGVLLQDFLQHTNTCVVTYVNSEVDFWACVSQNTFDILFLDYKLPGTTGLEILARMGQAGISIPTVMMTGEGSENIAARAIQAGALDYLVKGEYSFTSLPPLIQKAVRLREMQRSMQKYLEQIAYQSLLLDNMRDAVVVWGLDGAITYWNTAAEQLYGASAANRLGQPVDQVFFPCFDPPISPDAIQQSDSLEIERRIVAPHDLATEPEKPGNASRGVNARWVSAHITTLYNEADPKNPIGYMNVSRDITAMKMAEEKLQHRLDSEKLISTVSSQFINLSHGDIDQGVASAMQMVARFIQVGYAVILLWQDDHLVTCHSFSSEPEGRIRLMPDGMVLDPQSLPWLLAKLKRQEIVIINQSADLPDEASRDQAEIRRMGLRSMIALPMLHNNSLFGVMGFGTANWELRWTEEDIYVLKTFSELITSALIRKQMEEQIQAAQTHLAQAARLTSIGELASGVAHQISNPLTTIIAEAQILGQQLGPSHPGRESADAIVEAGWRAQTVINELMKFSQPSLAKTEQISVNQTIDQALLLASAHVQASGVRVDVDLAPDLPEITGNPRQLADLWVNLLLLARTSFKDGTDHNLRITTRAQKNKTIVVEFTDNGDPIPPEEYDKIFEPRLIPTGSGRGTGMELSLCREIVRQNQGEISVSGNGVETTFHITFSTEGL